METEKVDWIIKPKISISGWIRRTMLILRNWNAYKNWKGRRAGKKYADFRRGAGYYLKTKKGFGWAARESVLGQLWNTQMKSGRTGIYELIDYEYFSDPYDMVRYTCWMFIGYEGCKPIRECNFMEFYDLYVEKQKVD